MTFVAYAVTAHSMPDAPPSILIQDYDPEYGGPGKVHAVIPIGESGDLTHEDGGYSGPNLALFDKLLTDNGRTRVAGQNWNGDAGFQFDVQVEALR